MSWWKTKNFKGNPEDSPKSTSAKGGDDMLKSYSYRKNFITGISDEGADIRLCLKMDTDVSLLSHDGPFDYANVFAAAILNELESPLYVHMTSDPALVENVHSSIVVCDIGKINDPRDNLYVSGKDVRSNGIPYSSASLIWQDFGDGIVDKATGENLLGSSIDKIVNRVDEFLFESLDAYNKSIRTNYESTAASVMAMIKLYCPTDDELKSISFEAFSSKYLHACSFAKRILDTTIANACVEQEGGPSPALAFE